MNVCNSLLPIISASKKRNLPLFKKSYGKLPLFKKSNGKLPLFERSIVTEEEYLPLFRRRAPHHKRSFGNGGAYWWLRNHREMSPHSLWAKEAAAENERP